MKKKISFFIILLIFIAGLSLLLYPYVANEWNSYRQSQLITSYEEQIVELKEEGTIDYQAEKDKAIAYNQKPQNPGEAAEVAEIVDAFALAALQDEPDEEYMSCLNLTGDGTMGYIDIPKISVKLPIKHTVEEEVLEQAAGHLEGSSLPIGGSSTHSVVTAHRGLPSASLFTDLDKMEEGDHFLINVLDEVLCYEVDQILEVEPKDTEALQIEDGKDLVTLVTCTPYGVNTHRLLVRGHRVSYSPEAVQDEEIPLEQVSLHTNYLFWVVLGLGITLVVVSGLAIADRRRRKKAAKIAKNE